MSAEFRLLDDLTGDNENLYHAWQLFGGDAEALERARHAITMQVKEGLLEVVHKAHGQSRILVDWEVRQVLADAANWQEQGWDAEYFLSLTDAGAKYMGY